MKILILLFVLYSIQSLYAIETVPRDSLEHKTIENFTDSANIVLSKEIDTVSVIDTISLNDTLGIDSSSENLSEELLPYIVSQTNIYNLGAKEDECDVLAFCEDKEHFAIRVRKGERYAIHYPTFKKVFYSGISTAVISPDCQHVAFGALTNNNSYLYIDTQRINKDYYPWIKPKYNDDGSHILYFKENWNTLSSKPRRIIVVDSTEYNFDKLLGSIPVTWSPDKKHWASLVQKGRNSFLVLDGGRGPTYQGCKIGPIFTDDSKKIAYTAYRNDTCYLVIATQENDSFGGEFKSKKSDGYYKKEKATQTSPTYQELGGYRDIYGFKFADSSYEFVMQTVMNFDHYVETIDTTYGPYDTTFSFEFNDDNEFSFTAKKGNRFLIKTFDGQEKMIDTLFTKKASSVTDLGYSDDNLHSTFVVVDRDKSEHLYIDDSLVCSSEVYKYYAEFYPNSSDYYYFAREFKEVEDRFENKSVSFISSNNDTLVYQSMSPPLFSSDGSICALIGYKYSLDDKLVAYELIINGKVYQKYTDLIGFTEFDESDKLTLFVTENKKRVYKLIISPNDVITE